MFSGHVDYNLSYPTAPLPASFAQAEKEPVTRLAEAEKREDTQSKQASDGERERMEEARIVVEQSTAKTASEHVDVELSAAKTASEQLAQQIKAKFHGLFALNV